MKKIAIFQKNLAMGGIQRSLINLLNSLTYDNYTIDLYLFDEQKFYNEKIPEKVKIIYMKPSSKINKVIPFNLLNKKYQNKITKEYDVAIDFEGYSNDTALALVNCSAKKKVMWVHQDLEIRKKLDFKYKMLYYLTNSKYKYVDLFVCVSKGAMISFSKLNKISEDKCLVIPNIILANNIVEKSQEKTAFKVDKNKINLVTIGRLCYQKGFDILIKYMRQIVDKNENIILYIIGDGPDKNKLLKLIAKLKLNNNVKLLGSQTNPFNIMNKMDAFVLTSRFEGQGMVILEAKVLGLPIFITPNLEKYNEGILGSEDIVTDILNFKRIPKKNDMLEKYNINIINSFEKMIKD